MTQLTKTTQPTQANERTRLSPRINRDVARLAKSRAVAQDCTLEFVIEQLLKGYVNGTFDITQTQKLNGRTAKNSLTT